MRLVLATANFNKVAEIRPTLAGSGVELVAVSDLVPDWEVEETGDTLEHNARLKAKAATAATGSVAIADDTGLFVAALAGAPGVHSSRFSGPGATYASNIALLVGQLAKIPGVDRAAEFRTVVVVRRPDGEERVFEGTLAGRIIDTPRGDHGFGYDPVFELDDGRTLAELHLDEKNRVSHRARAFEELARFVETDRAWFLARP